MNIIAYPNDILNIPCTPITEFDESLKTLVEEMKQTMIKANGIGLSANQIGKSIQLFIVKDTKNEIHSFINPKILETEGTVLMTEGCLSAPNINLPIQRAATVFLEYRDISGETRRSMAQGIDARAILHEYDHIQGVFYFSKVNRAIRKIALSKLRKK